MRAKSVILLILALGCGLVASIGISQVIERNKQVVPVATETDNIIVAAKPIDAQIQIKPEHVKLEPWPKHLIPKGAITKLEDVDGQRARHGISPGEPILVNKLVGENEGNATGKVPPGYRLITVHADAVNAVGNLIKPNDRVDMLVYLKNFKGDSNNAGTKTILQDLKVFAVNDQWRPNEDQAKDSIQVKNVTLLVTPEQAEKITLATELGKIKHVLRSPDDTLSTNTGLGMTAAELLGEDTAENSRKAEQDMLAEKSKNSLMDLLGPQPEPAPAPAPVVAAAPTHQQFVMELLEGPAVRKIEFTKQDGPDQSWVMAGDPSITSAPSAASTGALPAAGASIPGIVPPTGAADGTLPLDQLIPPQGDNRGSLPENPLGPLLSE